MQDSRRPQRFAPHDHEIVEPVTVDVETGEGIDLLGHDLVTEPVHPVGRAQTVAERDFLDALAMLLVERRPGELTR